MERVNWNQAVRPSTHDLIAAINSGADDIERIDGALDVIETALDGKADVSGTYPDFVAGEALSIRSGIRSNTFLSRALDSDVADGIAEVDRILGNTVVWNQLYHRAAGSGTDAGITATFDGANKVTLNGTASNTSNWYLSTSNEPISFIASHKYLLRFEAQGTPNSGVRMMYVPANLYIANGSYVMTAAASNSDAGNLRIQIASGTVLSDYEVKVVVVDLTLAFGAGNEPTADQFDAMYPTSDLPYTPAPFLLSSNIAGIEGASVCEFTAQTLRGIGTAQDVMTKAGIERHIASVTINGTENWIKSVNTDNNLSKFYLDGLFPFTRATVSRIAGFDFLGYEIPFASMTAHSYMLQTSIANGRLGMCVDTSITTLEQFKAFLAANPFEIAYSLATPTTETFAEPIDLTYRVEAGGSESWIVPEGEMSAAVTGEIGYPLDPARALITHESFADFCDKLGAYIGATITETWDGSKYTYSFASGRSALLGSIEAEPDALEVTEKDDMVKEIIEDERKEQ